MLLSQISIAMSRGLDYSKWDKVDDVSSDEEEKSDKAGRKNLSTAEREGLGKLHGLKSVETKRAWEEIDRLQNIADGVFFKAEETHSTQEYQSSYKHYEEVLRLVEGTLAVEEKAAEAADGKYAVTHDSAAKARKHVSSCNLNLACCCIRAKKWETALQHCEAVLASTFEGRNLGPVEPLHVLRASHLRLYCTMQEAAKARDVMKQYEEMGIKVQDPKLNVLMAALEKHSLHLQNALLDPTLADSGSAYQKHLADSRELLKDASSFRANSCASEAQKEHIENCSTSTEKTENHKTQSSNERSSADKEIDNKEMKPLPHAGTSLQEAAEMYRKKEFHKACAIYQKVLDGIPPLPQASIIIDVSKGSEKEKRKAREKQGLALLRAISLSGMGSCHTALSSYDQGISELSISLNDFMAYIQMGISQHERVLDEKADYESPTVNEQQILTVARHAWNNMDNIMECHARLKQWLHALDICSEARILCDSLLNWETRIKNALKAAKATEEEMSLEDRPDLLKILEEGRRRKASINLARGHILKDMLSHTGTKQAKKAYEEYARRLRDEGKDSDKTDIQEEVIACWNDAAECFASEFGDHGKAADTFGMVASLLFTEAGSRIDDEKGALEPYLDWISVPRAVDVELAARAHEYFDQEVRHRLAMNSEIELEMGEIASKHKGSSLDANKKDEKIVLDADTQQRIQNLQTIRCQNIQLVLDISLKAALAALYRNQPGCAIHAEHSLDTAHEAYKSFIRKTPLEKIISKGTSSWREVHCLVADCRYHCALACFRGGKLQNCIETLQEAIHASDAGGDATRLQYALGLRGLAYTVCDRPEDADRDISAAASSGKMPVEKPDIIKQRVHAYIQQNLPKALKEHNKVKNTPKMMQLSPADAKRRDERRMQQLKAIQPVMRVEYPPTDGSDNGFGNAVRGDGDGKGESFVDRMQAFLTGDGFLNLAVAWVVALGTLVIIVAAAGQLWLGNFGNMDSSQFLETSNSDSPSDL